MNDERFERDLADVLRSIAGRDAPPSLRDRVASILDEAPIGRRLWFATPLRLSLAAVTVVAIVAIAIILRQPPQVGPLPSASPGTPVPSVESSASPEPSGASTAPTASPTPSVAPTPTPAAAWTGLNWSKAVVGPTTSQGRVMVNDVVPWHDGYVGVGSLVGNDDTVRSAFVTSADGLHWAITQLGEPISAAQDIDSGGANLHDVVTTSGGMLANGWSPMGLGAPTLWQSKDGGRWTVVDSQSWRDAWSGNHISTVASGPGGIVAFGAKGTGCCAHPDYGPVIVTSADGVTWTRLELSSVFDHAHVTGLTTYAGAFILVGYTGDYHLDADMNLVGSSRPAAWVSTDAHTWRAATVEGDEGTNAQLSEVIAGSDGLFALGRRPGVSPTGLIGADIGATSGWASSDGLTWHLVGDLGKELPDVERMAGDGSRMVLFGRDSCKASTLAGWTSTDGATWKRLPFSGSTSRPTIAGPICQDDGTEGWDSGGVAMTFGVVLPDGVLVVGWSSAPTGTYFWFASASGS